jgi:hypothetical protein
MRISSMDAIRSQESSWGVVRIKSCGQEQHQAAGGQRGGAAVSGVRWRLLAAWSRAGAAQSGPRLGGGGERYLLMDTLHALLYVPAVYTTRGY